MLRELTILGTVTLAAGACSTGSSEDERAAAVYVAVIRAVADEGPGDFEPDDGYDDRVVYAGPLGEATIPLAVQEIVVNDLRDADFATIRFVDDRDEAVRSDRTDEPVLEDGVLVLVDEVPDGDSLELTAERYLDADTIADFTVHTVADDDEWVVAQLEPRAALP